MTPIPPVGLVGSESPAVAVADIWAAAAAVTSADLCGDIAAVITYTRNAWGNKTGEVIQTQDIITTRAGK